MGVNDLQIEREFSNPAVIFGSDFVSVQTFYQYYLPPRSVCPQSWGLQESLTPLQNDELFDKMMDSIGLPNDDILFSSAYYFINNPDYQKICELELSDLNFTCDRRKGFFQINTGTKSRQSEHCLSSLSRHIRNSFAHGRIGILGEYITLEDKGNKYITGRIVLRKEDLLTWKRIIELYIVDHSLELRR